MGMSKKDFILIADRMKLIIEDKELPFEKGVFIGSLAGLFEDNYPRFKKDRWLDYIFGKCGPNGGEIKVDKKKLKN